MTASTPPVPVVVVPTKLTEAMKARARTAVRRAIDSGRLVRAEKCEKCGAPNRPCSDGRAYIHAHHHDYSKPLDVEWICAMCHRIETPLPAVMGNAVPGSRNGAARLTEADVRVIRQSPLGCIRLSRIYGVDKKTIQRARNGTRWNHV